MSSYRVSAWTHPNSVTFEPIEYSIPILSAVVQDDDSNRGRCTITVPASYDWRSIIFSDPADPSKNRTSLLRFFRDGVPNTGSPDFEALAVRWSRNLGEDGEEVVQIFGIDWRVAGLDEAALRWWDYTPGMTASSFGDWIYGGDNILSNPQFDSAKSNEIQWYHVHASAGTYTITVPGYGTTAPLQRPGVAGGQAADVKAALEGIAGINDVAVAGGGASQNDPFVVEFRDPGGADIGLMTFGVGSLTLTDHAPFSFADQEGGYANDPTPWTRSMVPKTGALHGAYADNGFRAAVAGTDPAGVTAGAQAWYVDGTKIFAGIQELVRVRPSAPMVAQVEIWPTSSLTDFRFVMRTTNEGYIASQPAIGGDGTLTANAWNTVDLSFAIPADMPTEQMIYRVGIVSSGDPAPFYIRNPFLAEGLPASTIGKIANDILDDAIVDHSPTLERLQWLTSRSFSDTLDSDSVAWPRNESITLRRGRKYGRHLFAGQFDELGYEYDLVPTGGANWRLDLWADGGRGVDRTAAGDLAFVWGAGVATGPAAGRIPNATRIFAEGADGIVAEVADATQEGIFGTVEEFIGDRDFLDSTSLGARAQQALDDDLGNLFAVTVELGPEAPTPYVEFDVGDSAYFLFPGLVGRHARRISKIELRADTTLGGELRWIANVTASRLFVGGDARDEAIWDLLTRFEKLESQIQEAGGDGVLTGSSGLAGFSISIASSAATEEEKARADYISNGVQDVDLFNLVAGILSQSRGFASAGGQIQCSSGEFWIDADLATVSSSAFIDLTAAPIDLLGAGTNATIFWVYGDASRAPFGCIRLHGQARASNFAISDWALSDNGVAIGGGQNLSDIEVDQWGGIGFYPAGGTAITDCLVSAVYSYSGNPLDAAGFYLAGNGTSLTGCKLYNSTGQGVRILDATITFDLNARITGCYFANCDDSAIARTDGGTNVGFVTNLAIVGCVFYSCGTAAPLGDTIRLFATGGVLIGQCVFGDNQGTSEIRIQPRADISLNEQGHTITGCTVHRRTESSPVVLVEITGIAAETVGLISIVGNTFSVSNSWVVKVDADNGNVNSDAYGIIVADNAFGSGGVYLLNVNDSRIAGNVFTQSDFDGVGHDGKTGLITLEDCKRVDVDGNRGAGSWIFSDPTEPDAFISLEGSCDKIRILDNAYSGIGLKFLAFPLAHGLRIGASVTNTYVRDNDFAAAGVSEIDDASAAGQTTLITASDLADASSFARIFLLGGS